MWVGQLKALSGWVSWPTWRLGVQDILITRTDNLNGFTDTIQTVFPSHPLLDLCGTSDQNPVNMSSHKDEKEFTADMKNICNAPNKRSCYAAELDNLEKKWEESIHTPYFQAEKQLGWSDCFPVPIGNQEIIYTTNLIENLNEKLWKYTNQSFHSQWMMP